MFFFWKKCIRLPSDFIEIFAASQRRVEMLKNKQIQIESFIFVFACLALIAATGESQASLIVADPGQTPLVGIGTKENNQLHKFDGMDSIENVDWLLDNYYGRDVDVFSIGKYEELYIDDEPQGELVPVDFQVLWNPDWFTYDGNILDKKSGTGYINIPTDSTFNWTGYFWYSMKAGSSFGLYGSGELVTLKAGVSFEIPWDIGISSSNPSGFATNGLSHFSLWGETVSTPVPEPTTMLLFGTGLAGLAATIRRKKK